jgi:hypothetical protein
LGTAREIPTFGFKRRSRRDMLALAAHDCSPIARSYRPNAATVPTGWRRKAIAARVLGFCLLQDGDVGIGVFPEVYCGSPTFRTNSANRGSERRGSSKKSVFKPSSRRSRS